MVLTGFDEQKRGKNDSKVFDLISWKNEIVLYQWTTNTLIMEKAVGRTGFLGEDQESVLDIFILDGPRTLKRDY